MVGPTEKKFNSVEERQLAHALAKEAKISEAEKRRLDLIGEISRFFSKADADGNSQVSPQEFEKAMADPSMADCIKKLRLPLALTSSELFSYLDGDSKGYISAIDLVDGCSRWAGDSERILKKILAKR